MGATEKPQSDFDCTGRTCRILGDGRIRRLGQCTDDQTVRYFSGEGGHDFGNIWHRRCHFETAARLDPRSDWTALREDSSSRLFAVFFCTVAPVRKVLHRSRVLPDCAYSWRCGLWLYAAAVCAANGSIGDQGRGRRFRVHECSVAAWRYACPARGGRSLWQHALLWSGHRHLGGRPLLRRHRALFSCAPFRMHRMVSSQLPLRQSYSAELTTPRPAKNESRLSSTRCIIAARVSCVLLAMCGVSTTLSSAASADESPARSRKHQGLRPRCAYSRDGQSEHPDRPQSRATR